MKFARQIKFEHVLSLSMVVSCLILTMFLTGCGASSADLAAKDKTPDDYYEGAKVLAEPELVKLAASNPLFDVTDYRGLHYGTVAITAGNMVPKGLPFCLSAVPGPMANCVPKGAKVVDGRVSFGVAEFGGETGLYFINKESICFSQMSNMTGCHRLAVRYDRTIEVQTSEGAQHLWVRQGA